MKNEKPQSDDNVAVNINLDTTPILYTDNIHMTTNEDGVILDVMQRVGNPKQMRIVSRIGMSRSHAKKFVEKLGKLLALTEGNIQSAEKPKN